MAKKKPTPPAVAMPSCYLNLTPDHEKCKHSTCSRCGHNPDVAAARKRLIRIYGPDALIKRGDKTHEK